MHIFMTGASGFIGTALVQELIEAGHRVTGLARSDSSAQSLMDAGAEVHRGDLEDLDSLRRGAEHAEAVIHAGFIHDFARFKEVCEIDRQVIEALGSVLAGSERPLIVTSGTALVSSGRIATEDMKPDGDAGAIPRVASEEAADAAASHGALVSVIRLSPSVHGAGDHHGFVPMLIRIAREKGFSGYIGEGTNRWTAVHRLDAVRLYRSALENSTAGARFHGVADEGIAFKDIAEAIGRQLNLPVATVSPEGAASHFGWFSTFAALDCPASNRLTCKRLNWQPTEPSLLSDLDQGIYAEI